MNPVRYRIAQDFDQAWLNFELDLPLLPIALDQPNPFYINRNENPLPAITDTLLAPFYNPPKLFLGGHRGNGKSTEAHHLLADGQVNEKYWPVYFSIRDEADVIDLDYKDVLLAIGSNLYRQFRAEGGKLTDALAKELELWRGKVEEEITTVLSNKITGVEFGAGLEAFFANASLRMRMEPKTRRIIRQVIASNVNGLLDVINKIVAEIEKIDGRTPLVVIDDLDKTSLKVSKDIFKDHFEVMTQPGCAIVYVVSSALFFSKEFDSIREHAYFLPNVILTDPANLKKYDSAGYVTMRKFVTVRMSNKLIEPSALMTAITFSGGVFRELARIMRTAISKSRRRGAYQITEADVIWAVNEIRNDFRRILEEEDLKVLKKFDSDHLVQYHERVNPLMQLSALMEYKNGKNWFGVHPIVKGLLHE